MKENTVSAFMLESFRLREINPENKKAVEEALFADSFLCARLDELEKSDNELRRMYPFASLNINTDNIKQFPKRHFPSTKAKISLGVFASVGALAAALLLFFLPAFNVLQNNQASNSIAHNDFIDRPKGQDAADTFTDAELFVYLKEAQDALPEKTSLREGNTVQLAYSAPSGAERYGVIFSIDGRSSVTMHYPYSERQSSLLVSGRHTFLDEAYTLDDAPDYEVFVFVVSDNPLNIKDIISGAEKLAAKADSADGIKKESSSAFADYEVETVTVLKNAK